MKTKETILLVEDEINICLMIRMFLEAKGYKVLEAGSGSQALALWKRNKNQIDLVLTDLLMPGGITGIQLGERLRNDRPDVKVIFTSGSDCEDDAFFDSTTNFLAKPYRLTSLSEMIRRSLDTLEQAA